MNSIPNHSVSPSYQESVVPVWDITSRVVAIALTPITYLTQFFSRQSGKQPPEAFGHTLFGSLPEFAAMNWDTLNFIVSYHQKYGMEEGISKLTLLNKVFYVISDPAKAKLILRKPSAFVRGKSLKVWQKFSKGGLTEGKKTQEYRGQAVKAIGAKEIENYFAGIVDVSNQWMLRLGNVNNLDIMKEMERATLAAMSESLFKKDPSDPLEENPFGLEKEKDEISFRFLNAYHTVFEMMTRRVTSGLASVPFIGDSLYSFYYPEDEAAIRTSKETLVDILRPIFEELLKDPEKIKPQSHLRTLFQHFDIDPYNADINDITEKCLGFLQAAFETSSKSLGWTLYSLAKDDALQTKLRDELLDEFNGKAPNELEELKKIPLLSQVMEESLRLFPPFPFLVRDILQPEKFEEYEVEKGGTFVISPLLIQRSSDNWDDPLSFNPKRWKEEMLTDKWQIANPKYMSFLGGMHRCPGRFFGKQEILIFLSQFLQNYKISLGKDTENIGLKLNITLHPNKPIVAHIEKI